MQQRRLRLGDILDDYCPRERRITNHAVVAMIEDDVRQTRCTTCDAEHEYKQAKVPVSRRKKAGDLPGDQSPVAASALVSESVSADAELLSDSFIEDEPLAAGVDEAMLAGDGESDESLDDRRDDEGPVHRRLIRATLPRPEGQTPERKAPDFTMRQPTGGRFDQQRNGQRHRGRPQPRQAGQAFGQPARSGGPRQGSGRPGGDPGARQGNGNRPGNTANQRDGRPFASNRGPRPGGGQGRKRGR